jgi:hypothetical protein
LKKWIRISINESQAIVNCRSGYLSLVVLYISVLGLAVSAWVVSTLIGKANKLSNSKNDDLKRMGFWTYVWQFAPAISAVSALLAFCFSIFVYYQTQKLLEPTERPIISLSEQYFDSGCFKESSESLYVIKFEFKNIGKHPAKNVRMRLGWGRVDQLDDFSSSNDLTMANRLDALGGVITLPQAFKVPAQILTLNGQEVCSPLYYNEIYIYLIMTYSDELDLQNYYCDEYWLKYVMGEKKAKHSTLSDKNMLEPHVVRIYGNENTRCNPP